MKHFLVIDGFYEQPDRVRAVARDCEWLTPDALGPKFPGIESRRSFYSDNIVGQIEKLVGSAITVDAKTLPFGVFSLGLEKHEQNRVVHVDPCEWTGVVYLTPNDYCQGGTALYRHRATGLTRIPRTPEELSTANCQTTEDFVSHTLEADQNSLENWDVDISANMKFNRMILFRSDSFHASTGYFGKSFADARLIQLFFFNSKV